jgi:dihydroorotase-like cyclic amidohydrolase
MDSVYRLEDARMRTRCGWTPFAGRQVTGRVDKVVLRGETVFDGEKVLAAPGSGRVLFQEGG